MEKDISNQTVMVLAILTILVSLLSVSTIFMETADTQTNTQSEDSTTGTIKLDLKETPQESNSQGQINLQIKEQNE